MQIRVDMRDVRVYRRWTRTSNWRRRLQLWMVQAALVLAACSAWKHHWTIAAILLAAVMALLFYSDGRQASASRVRGEQLDCGIAELAFSDHGVDMTATGAGTFLEWSALGSADFERRVIVLRSPYGYELVPRGRLSAAQSWELCRHMHARGVVLRGGLPRRPDGDGR